MNKILAFILSLVSLLIGGYLLLEFQGLGFPDGHLTELELSLEKLYPFYIFIYVLFAGYFLYLGFIQQANNPILKPRSTLVSFVVFFIFMLFVNGYLASILDHGAGG